MLIKRQLFNFLIKRNISALYVSGDKAKENYAVLTPYLDFQSRFQDLTSLENNIKKRKSSIKLNDLLNQYELYNSIQLTKQKLEKRKLEIVDELRKRIPDQGLNVNEHDPLKIEGRTVRDDLKTLKEKTYTIDDVFINNFLSLPNDIHINTPIEDEREILSYLKCPEIYEHQSHIMNENLVEYYDPTCYYLKNEAALFDLFAPIEFVNYFKRKNSFIQFSNPDFVKTILMDAATIKQEDVYKIKDEHALNDNKVNLLHLAGGSSLLSFLGYITKLSLYEKAFPLKFITMGKQYSLRTDVNSSDIFDSSQATTVQFFMSTTNEDDANDQIDILIEEYIKCYKQFDQHFRMCYVTAEHLLPSESMKISLQMYSPGRQTYVEVGNISFYSDFISKRLLFNWRDGKEYKFPHIVSGTVANIPTLLGVLIENKIDLKECLEKLSILNKLPKC